MLLNDFYTYELRSSNSNNVLSPHCRLPGCDAPVEDVVHVLTCPATSSVRTTLLNQLRNICLSSVSQIDFDSIAQEAQTLTQFLLDCSSENLSISQRMKRDDPDLLQVFIISRRIINSTHQARLKLLKSVKIDNS